jgi:hypothetical protein
MKMAFHNDDFCRAIAMVLQGESKKAATYVTHAASLGTLREKMVSNFVRHETPERFRVETGLIRNHARNLTSCQCDLLVHDPWWMAPIYRYEDFVVVKHTAAKAVVEVKSNLYEDDFERLLKIHASVLSCCGDKVPTFGYGLTGATMPTLAEYLQDAIAGKEVVDGSPFMNWPLCIAVQERNVVGFRPHGSVAGEKDMPFCFCLVDLTKLTNSSATPVDGLETGLFLELYSWMIRDQDCFPRVEVYRWFNNLPLLPDGKMWVAPDGKINKGEIPYK